MKRTLIDLLLLALTFSSVTSPFAQLKYYIMDLDSSRLVLRDCKYNLYRTNTIGGTYKFSPSRLLWPEEK